MTTKKTTTRTGTTPTRKTTDTTLATLRLPKRLTTAERKRVLEWLDATAFDLETSTKEIPGPYVARCLVTKKKAKAA